MNESDQSGHEIRSDAVQVEVIDLGGTDEATSRHTEMYREVTILDNGWLQCVGRDGSDRLDGVCADYYPPERVNGVFTDE